MALRSGFDAARDLRAWFVLAFALAGARACGLNAQYQKLPNGDLRVTCRGALAPCLRPAADACAEYGYDVIRAEERRETTGSPPEAQQFVVSEATVRCRRAKLLFGRDPNEPVPSAAPPPPASTVPRCVPGASQACATPTCTGAQVCAPDGTHFAACECAPAAAPSAPTPTASSAPAVP